MKLLTRVYSFNSAVVQIMSQVNAWLEKLINYLLDVSYMLDLIHYYKILTS